MIPLILPSVALPIVRPVNVTVITVCAARFEFAVVMTMVVEVKKIEFPEPPLIEVIGVATSDMKPKGYINEMVLPGINKPPGVVMNEKVMAHADLAEMRSVPRIEKVACVT